MDDELLLPCEKNGCDMAAIGVMRSSGSIVSMRSIHHPMVNDDDDDDGGRLLLVG